MPNATSLFNITSVYVGQITKRKSESHDYCTLDIVALDGNGGKHEITLYGDTIKAERNYKGLAHLICNPLPSYNQLLQFAITREADFLTNKTLETTN